MIALPFIGFQDLCIQGWQCWLAAPACP